MHNALATRNTALSLHIFPNFIFKLLIFLLVLIVQFLPLIIQDLSVKRRKCTVPCKATVI